jgi:hypothetical protein
MKGLRPGRKLPGEALDISTGKLAKLFLRPSESAKIASTPALKRLNALSALLTVS